MMQLIGIENLLYLAHSSTRLGTRFGLWDTGLARGCLLPGGLLFDRGIRVGLLMLLPLLVPVEYCPERKMKSLTLPERQSRQLTLVEPRPVAQFTFTPKLPITSGSVNPLAFI